MMAKKQRAEWVMRGSQDPKKAFTTHAAGAALRGIPFEMTFDEWWSIWEPHYQSRGCASDQLVMCRYGDEGPYAVGNVRIDTVRGNLQEARQLGVVARRRALANKAETWTMLGNAFSNGGTKNT